MGLFLRKAADRIGADEVLIEIDVLMNLRSCSPTCKRSFRGSRVAAAIIDAKLVQSAARPGSHSSVGTQAQRVKNGSKTTPSYEDDIQRLCPP
ncbi:MAG: hypothetical protein GDA36_14035 [Rhodobacteraceae bacterium]|nr:hypothetical protein [Paracoccaceae bacterium]